MELSRHVLSLVLIPLCVVAAGFSFYRFVIGEDYIVQYEGVCDPEVESCFTACEDDACSSVYHFSSVQKYAAEVHASCGADITDCEAASMCLPTDTFCEIEYCSAETGECQGPGVSSNEQTEEEVVEEDISDEDV